MTAHVGCTGSTYRPISRVEEPAIVLSRSKQIVGEIILQAACAVTALAFVAAVAGLAFKR
jgi:hypothetical protein